MSFRLLAKSVTLNDLERGIMALILRYFAEFVNAVIVNNCFRPIPRFKNLLLIVYDHINTICAITQRVFGQNKRRQ